MKTYMIGYDLNKAGKNYSELIDAIKALADGYWHNLDSTWLVNSNLDASQIIDKLTPKIDSDDEILVIAVADDWACYGFNEKATQWLRESPRPACRV